jgi:hypothetical protein
MNCPKSPQVFWRPADDPVIAKQRRTQSIEMNINITSLVNQSQEAMETAAQTKAEAAKGDQQAMRKLARTQAANNVQSAPPPPPPPQRGLDVKA